MKKFLMIVAMVLSFTCLSFAQETTTPVATPATTPLVSITEMLNATGAQAGYFHGFRANRGYTYLASKIAVIGPEKWNLSLNGGLISTSGLAATVDYDLMKAFTLQQVPVLGFFSTAKVGAGIMISDMTLWTDRHQINHEDNIFDYGVDALLSKTIKFGPQTGK